MVLGKRWLFSIGNGAEIRPLEMGRKSPVVGIQKNGLKERVLLSTKNNCYMTPIKDLL